MKHSNIAISTKIGDYVSFNMSNEFWNKSRFLITYTIITGLEICAGCLCYKFYRSRPKDEKKTSAPVPGTPTEVTGGNGNPDSNEPEDEVPVWEYGGEIKDKETVSELLGHSGGLILISGGYGAGKSGFLMTNMVESCMGMSFGLLPEQDNISDAEPLKCYLYYSECDEKFETHYGNRLKQLKSLFMVRHNDFNFSSYESFLKDLRKTVIEANDSCVIGIDNVTDMFPTITSAQIRKFKNGIEEIQKEAAAKGNIVTVFVVSHTGRNSTEARGSSNWENLFYTVISIEQDPNSDDENAKVVTFKKRRGAACGKPIHVKRLFTEGFMHFENVSNPHTAVLSPVTHDVEELIYDAHLNGKGYGTILNMFKDQYALKDKQHVVNIIRRVEKRKMKQP